MRRGFGAAILLWIAVWGVVGARDAVAAGSTRTVLTLSLNGVVDPFTASYVSRGIDLAGADHDAAVLLTIDTPGGLDSSMRSIIKSILVSRVPVICYTAPSGARAASAGTFIMMGCPISAMAPGTNIGAAHPVGVTGAIEQAKVTNDAAAFIASLANRWGRNADWAKKSVRNATSVTAETAVKIHAVDLLAPTQGSLLNLVGGCSAGSTGPPTTTGLLGDEGQFVSGLCGATTRAFDMSITEGLFHAFADPNVAFLLLEIGFIALIVWVIHPAFHVMLAVGIVLTVLGLLILETLPVRLSGLLLLLLAAVLFVLDVKAKAHGVLTAGGLAVLILGGLLLFNPSVPTAHVSVPLLVFVAVGVAAFTFFVLRSLVASREAPIASGQEVLLGSGGVALTALEPRGTVRVRGETWTADAADGSIPSGAPVRVVRVQGVRLVVEAAPVVSEGEPVGPTGADPRGGNRT